MIFTFLLSLVILGRSCFLSNVPLLVKLICLLSLRTPKRCWLIRVNYGRSRLKVLIGSWVRISCRVGFGKIITSQWQIAYKLSNNWYTAVAWQIRPQAFCYCPFKKVRQNSLYTPTIYLWTKSYWPNLTPPNK